MCIKFKKTNKANTDVWQIVWGMAPTSREKNPCQNVSIVLLVGNTHWDVEQVSGLFFFLGQPAAWPCVAIS